MVEVGDKMESEEKLNGHWFDVHTIREVQLYPLQAGTFTIDAMELEMGGDNPYTLSLKRGKPTKRSYTLAAWIRGEVEAGKGREGGEGEGQADDVKSKVTTKATADPKKPHGVNVIYVAVAIQREFPGVPYAVGAAAYAGLITLLNLCGIRWTARSNEVLLAAMSIVVSFFIILAIRYVLGSTGIAGLFSFQPFYNPATFDMHRMATATSFAALKSRNSKLLMYFNPVRKNGLRNGENRELLLVSLSGTLLIAVFGIVAKK